MMRASPVDQTLPSQSMSTPPAQFVPCTPTRYLFAGSGLQLPLKPVYSRRRDSWAIVGEKERSPTSREPMGVKLRPAIGLLNVPIENGGRATSRLALAGIASPALSRATDHTS